MDAKQQERRWGRWLRQIGALLRSQWRIWTHVGKKPSGVRRAESAAAPTAAAAEELAGAGLTKAAENKLLEELRTAHLEWACARQRFDYALEEDEIDYAIFSLETAEKRYSMLIKQAKSWNVQARNRPTAFRFPEVNNRG